VQSGMATSKTRAEEPRTEEERNKILRNVCHEYVQNSGPVDEWTPAKVAQFLEACSRKLLLGQKRTTGNSLPDIFRKHGVRGRQLVLLDSFTGNQQLKAPPFSIASLGQRLKLLDAVKVLIEEEVESRVSATAAGTKAQKDGRPKGMVGGSSNGAVAEMLGRTCISSESLRNATSQGDLMATVPAWRSSAFPPSGWIDPGEAGRTMPSTELELEFVFGYSGSRARGNLCSNDSGEIIFPASRVMVVFNIETRTQRFFLQHTDEVSAVSMHPGNIIVATGEHGPRGTICVWDSQSIETLAVLLRSSSSSAAAAGKIGVSAVSFAGDKGEILAAVTQDMMVMIWQWKDKQLIASTCAGTGRVYAARANPHKDRLGFTLVTAGTQCVRFWTFKTESSAATAQEGASGGGAPSEVALFGVYGSVGDFGVQQAAVSVEFLDSNTTVMMKYI